MKVVLIPDSFKGTFSALEIIEIFKDALHRRAPYVCLKGIPMADGGEGSLEAFAYALSDFRYSEAEVCGPLPDLGKIKAFFGIAGKTAYIEMAQVAGLSLVPEHLRNPKNTTTYGVGELIKIAADANIERLIMAIGGSATSDGGLGMLLALGAKVETAISYGHMASLGTGGNLKDIQSINLEPLRQWRKENPLEVTVMCDVSNPLTGENGAVKVYGPQKGATAVDVTFLESGMKHLERLLNQPELTQMPGAGAAGGLGAALAIGLNASLVSGAELILDLCDFESLIQDADLLITGEGTVDFQTLNGKVALKVLERAKKLRPELPVILLAGRAGLGYEAVLACGFEALFTCNQPNEPLSSDGEVRKRKLEAAVEALIKTYISD